MTTGSLFVALLLKPAIVIAGARVFAWVLRRRSAAARHAIWTGAVGAVLALPLLRAVVPPLRIGAPSDGVLAPIMRAPAARVPRTLVARALLDQSASPVASRGPGPRARAVSPRVGDALGLVWGAAALLLVLRRVAAELMVRRIVGRGRPPSAALSSRSAAIARARGIRQPVRVVLSDEAATPAVAGLLRPVVILPASAERWPDAETSAVLVHELSHVARRDCAINLIAELTVAIHWCNPLVRLAARRIRAEGERACDDDVLRAGGEPDAYALLLVAFARAARAARATGALPGGATAMARPSELESRVLAVLDARVSRAPLRRWVGGSLATLSAVLALPVAAATLTAAPSVSAGQILAPEPDRLGDSVAAPASERVPLTLDDRLVEAAATRALAGPDSALAATLLVAVRNPPSAHDYDLVRDRAAWALSQTRGDRLIEPLLEALDAGDWRVQAYAAWTLGVAGEHRAVPTLIPLVRHPVWRLRAMAASTLRQLGDPRSAEVMTLALTDPAWQVRVEAVDYLAALGGHGDELRARLNDRHVAVRQAAARAVKAP